MNDSQLNSPRAPEPVGAYPHAKCVGNLLFLSGVGPRKRDSKAIPGVTLDDNGNIISYDIEAQCRSCFDNVRVILEDAGSSWDRIVDVLVFLTNMKDDFETYNAVYAEYFPDQPPARSAVVNNLLVDVRVEVEVVAYKPQ